MIMKSALVFFDKKFSASLQGIENKSNWNVMRK